MTTITFDTLKLTQKLREAGFAPEQAEKTAEALSFALKETDLTEFATKRDLAETKNEIVKWVVATAMGQAALFLAVMKIFP